METVQIKISFLILSNKQMPCLFFPFTQVQFKSSCKIYLFPDSAASYHTFWKLQVILFNRFSYEEVSVCHLVLLNPLL